MATEPTAIPYTAAAVGIFQPGAWVLKVDPQGKVEVQGRKWKISKALCGEWVQLLAIEDRVLVYYCATLFREIDLRLGARLQS